MSKCVNQWPTGTEVVARYNFIGKADEDLSFQKGDIITITHQTRVRQFNTIFIYNCLPIMSKGPQLVSRQTCRRKGRPNTSQLYTKTIRSQVECNALVSRKDH
jgi:hypothetical protein